MAILSFMEIFKEIDYYISYFKIEEAQVALAKLESKELNEYDEFEFLYLKIKLLRKIGKLHEAKNKLISLEKLPITKKNQLFKLRTLSLKIKTMIWLGCMEEAEKITTQAEDLFKTLNEESQINTIFKIDFYLNSSEFYYNNNNFNKIFDYCNQVLELAKPLNEKLAMAFAYEIMGLAYNRMNEINRAFDFINNAIVLLEEIENESHLAIEYHHLGLLFNRIGEYEKSIEYLKKTLPFVKRLNDDSRYSVQYFHMGIVYYNKGDFDKAKKYLLLSLEKQESIRNDNIISFVLMCLINIAEYLDDYKQVDSYLAQLKEIEKTNKDKIIKFRIKLAEGVTLKNSPRSIDRGKAENIFREFLNKEDNDNQIHHIALINLAEILLQDFLQTGNDEILEELQTITFELLENAKKQELPRIRLEAYNIRLLMLWIQAQYSQNQVDIKEIQNLLMKSQELANEKGLHKLAETFSIRYERLLNHAQQWDSFIRKYYKYFGEEKI